MSRKKTAGIKLVGRVTMISSQEMNRDVSCYLCQISKMQGFDDLEPTRNLEIIPTATASSIENRDPIIGDWEREGFDPEGSLDVRWGITQDIYLNATINPDFSQVCPTVATMCLKSTRFIKPKSALKSSPQS